VDSVHFPSFLSHSARIENSGLKLMNFSNVLQHFQKIMNASITYNCIFLFLGWCSPRIHCKNKRETWFHITHIFINKVWCNSDNFFVILHYPVSMRAKSGAQERTWYNSYARNTALVLVNWRKSNKTNNFPNEFFYN
jgi:hypothetical protein